MTAIELLSEVKSSLAAGAAKADLRIKYLGRKGKLTELLRGLRDLPEEVRKTEGAALNNLRLELEQLLEEASSSHKLADGWSDNPPKWDITTAGHLHPVSQFLRQLVGIFQELGFQYFEGNEVESTEYNFDKLNVPKDHPARDSQDTFYLAAGDENSPIETNLVLRTQVSNMQTRIVSANPTPIRAMYPGQINRNEATDARHLATLYQFETLAIEPGITLRHLLWTLSQFAERLVGQGARARFRPSFFPFVEPGLEVDLTCLLCEGQGCRVCNQTGWLEAGGAGMIHPNVILEMGLNAEEHQGFAFGMGVERMLLLAAGIPDIRMLYDNDVRFLRQF